MRFETPIYLLLLGVVLPALAVALGWLERSRRSALEAFGSIPVLARSSLLPSRSRRALTRGLVLLGLALIVIALARPQFGRSDAAFTRRGRDVLVLLDLSRSMNARDLAPNRLAVAKQAALEVVRASPGDRVGLIVFGGSAFLQLPLTLDRAAFEQFLDSASPSDLGDLSTNLSTALRTAATVFLHEADPGYRVALVVSDGETLRGNLDQSIRLLRGAGVRTFALGLGTPEGAPIPDSTAGEAVEYHRDHIGRVVVSRLDEGTLGRLARVTGGDYVRWSGEASVRRLQAAIAAVSTREIAARRRTALADRFQWPLALGIIALLAASVTADGGVRRAVA